MRTDERMKEAKMVYMVVCLGIIAAAWTTRAAIKVARFALKKSLQIIALPL
jgi:hypothetical protein